MRGGAAGCGARTRCARARRRLRRDETSSRPSPGGPDSVALARRCARQRADGGCDARPRPRQPRRTRPSAWQDEAVVLGARRRAARCGCAPSRCRPARRRERALARRALRGARRRSRGTRRARASSRRTTPGIRPRPCCSRSFAERGRAVSRGMAASRPLAPGITLERPLLEVGAETLRAYCARAHVPYALDPSNGDRPIGATPCARRWPALRPSFPQPRRWPWRAARALLREERAGTDRAALRALVRAELASAAGPRAT